jgi:NtrC-family two-component system sensor histidine kinase KinB
MLRTRLLLAFLAVLCLLAAVGMHALWTTRQVGRTVAETIATSARGLLLAERLKQEANRLGNALRQLRALDSFPHRAEFQAAREDLRRWLRSELEQTPEAGGRWQKLEAVETAVARLEERAADLTDTGRPLQVLQADEAALYAVLQAAEELAGYDTRLLAEAEARAALLTERSTAIFSLGLGAAVLFTLALAWILGGLLLQPIRQLTASAAALGEGRLERDVPVTSRDELGELARTFNTMAARLRAYRDAMTEKARQAQRTMEATLTSAPDPVFVVTKDGHTEARNPPAEALELAEGWPEGIAGPLQEVLATGTHYLPTEYSRIVTLQDRHYLPRILAIGDELTDFRGAALILQDVTKFRLLDDAKTNLVGTVSHELKTPLTSLRMSLYLLLEQQVGALSANQVELLETARNDADRLLRILNDLLDLSRIEGGVMSLDLAPVPVGDLLVEMAREVQPLTEAAGQTVTVTAEGAPARAPMDRDRIRHVFINLLTNASKYSPEGSGIVLYAEAADGGLVRFGVRDSGPGLNEAEQRRVFEKFYRVPGQAKKGAGLGLAICREIVVAHGGSIACSSAPGGGCDFHFLLPSDPNPQT